MSSPPRPASAAAVTRVKSHRRSPEDRDSSSSGRDRELKTSGSSRDRDRDRDRDKDRERSRDRDRRGRDRERSKTDTTFSSATNSSSLPSVRSSGTDELGTVAPMLFSPSSSSSPPSPPPTSSLSSSSSISAAFTSAQAKFREEQEIVVLNVGGTRFETRRVTLCQRASMLSVMFGGGVFAAPAPDSNGEFFFDRDPTHFRYLLNFLRTGKVFLPAARDEQLELLLEAEYFGIDAVASAIKRAMQLPRHFSLSASNSFEEKKHSPARAWDGVACEGLLLCLEASSLDVLADQQPNANWPDSRGGAWPQAVFVGPPPVVGEDEQSVRYVELAPLSGHVTIPLNVNPQVRPLLSVEVWVKLLSVVPGSDGWLLGQVGGDAALARSIALHDERFGTTAGVGHVGVGAGSLFTSALGPLPLQQWSHIVVTWDQQPQPQSSRSGHSTTREGRAASLTVHLNGTAFEPPVEPRNVDSSVYITLGHPSCSQQATVATAVSIAHQVLLRSAASRPGASNADELAAAIRQDVQQHASLGQHGVHCQVAALRLYEGRLSPEQIDANYRSFAATFPPPQTFPIGAASITEPSFVKP